MSNDWYELVGPEFKLTQGDLIFHCPLITWKSGPYGYQRVEGQEAFNTLMDVISTDVIVMTQACDLEHDKVRNVVLCPHLSIVDYKEAWENDMRKNDNSPSNRAWKSHFDDICDGYLWNLAVLNSFNSDEISMDRRVVDFHDIFTVPSQYLQALLEERNEARLRLLPPYREHLSQAFARFFMRVGLPNPVKGT